MRTTDPDFVPPFCPRPECCFHDGREGFRFARRGFYRRQVEPSCIRRYQCLACGLFFSTQTFDTTYYLKKPHLQQRILEGLVACCAYRQLGRWLRVGHSTVQRQVSRLGRHCLLFQSAHGPSSAPTEPLALDGFVSFEYSQFWPFEINTLVGRSHFVYAMTSSELRRSGRMTARQKARRAHLEQEHGRPDPQATRKAVETLIRLVAPEPAPLDVTTDEHQAYQRAFRRLPHPITHRTVSSRRCRSARNPLFSVDLLDLLLRHASANHKRETIAFSKRRQGALERAAVLQVWRNFMKRTSENDRSSLTPAQALGLVSRPLLSEDVLSRRLLPSRVPLPEPLQSWYWRLVPTRQLPNGTVHAVKRAA